MESKVYTQEDIEKAYKEVRNDFTNLCKRGNMECTLSFIGMLAFLKCLGYFTDKDFLEEKDKFRKDVMILRRSNGLKH